MILAGDVGGTKTNLAYFVAEGQSLTPTLVKSYPSQQYRSLNEVVQRLLSEHPAEISAAAFGIAGPVVDGRSKLTNLGWEVDSREVAALLKLHSVGLVNDLQATAYGTLRLSHQEKLVLNAGVPQPHAPIAVIAAGTGLGEGALIWDGRRYRAIPSEGGHTDFGPRNEVEIELLRFLTKKFGRVSYERIVAGPGIVNLYEFFRSRANSPEPPWLRERIAAGDPSAAISQAGMDGADPVCVEVLTTFASLYGAEAGNLALKILATGGVYVGGGIAPKILPIIKQHFIEAFTTKGRYSNLMKQMPVYIVLNDKTALVGAAHYALVMND
ncbi:MAG: Glucokinase [Bacteroidetes bacterium]|nr:Glucokinase [Bacteroidota bacterium]